MVARFCFEVCRARGVFTVGERPGRVGVRAGTANVTASGFGLNNALFVEFYESFMSIKIYATLAKPN